MPFGSRYVDARPRRAVTSVGVLTLGLVLALPMTGAAGAGTTTATSVTSAPRSTAASGTSLTSITAATSLSDAISSTVGLASRLLDTTSRVAVTAQWRSQWLPAARAKVSLTGGSVGRCAPYRTSATTLQKMKAALNYARALAGVPPLTSLADPSNGAARSALIQVANRFLSHSPGPRSTCYSSAGARTAGRSDLGLWGNTASGWRPTVASVIRSYLTDNGRTNAEAAHRIWLLRSAARQLATGFAVNRTGGWTWVSNNIAVFPTKADVSGGPKFHSWPAGGYFPIQLEPAGRWSISATPHSIHFAHARVQVTRNGRSVKVVRLLPSSGYGDHSLTWQLAARPTTGTYCVTVSGISGSKPYSYCTTLFRP